MLIQSAHEPDLAAAFAHDDRAGEQGVGVSSDRALHLAGVAGACDDVLSTAIASHDMQLMGTQFRNSRRGMARREHLQRGNFFFCTKRSEQSDDAVRLQTIFKFIDQEGRSLVRSLSLQRRDKQTRRAQAEIGAVCHAHREERSCRP